jgi:VanZ family protein
MPVKSWLSHYSLLILLAIISYASLSPFVGWQAADDTQPFFLLQKSSWLRAPRFDFWVNILMYVPLGATLFRALWAGQGRGNPRFIAARAWLYAALFSLLMEWVQTRLPVRVASGIDWLANCLGAGLGVWLALWYSTHRTAWGRVRQLRDQLFIPGGRGDAGLVLIALWFVAQSNPALPLFATTYLPQSSGPDSTQQFTAMAQTVLNVVGIGLFADLLMRTRYLGGLMMASIIVLATVCKALMAWLMLKPDVFSFWLAPAVSMGVAIAAFALLAFVPLSRRTKSVLANTCLIVGLLAPLLLPDLFLSKAPLQFFDWSRGHLRNFNALTHAILNLWPILASLYLFTGAASHDAPK